MGKLIDLTGQRFGKLTVIKRADEKAKHGEPARWLCQCDCGNTTVVDSKCLRRGTTVSCGCYRKEKQKDSATKHGGAYDRLYRNVYFNMKNRCYNPNNSKYKDYGARGITICDEWNNDYSAFKAFMLANGYDENAEYQKTTIDRIDVNGNYCPENCRVVTNEVQANNKRNNRYISFNGETHTLTEWAKITGISRNTIKKRLEYGWNEIDAIAVAPNRANRVLKGGVC